MNYLEKIKEYVPYDDMEAQDRENILKYISLFGDVLCRSNNLCHFTSSAFILNKKRNRVLVLFHNIYNSWDWIGGHADGEANLLEVAKREIVEETGITSAVPISEDIFSLDITPCPAYTKKGKKISTHVHLSVLYLFEADEKETLIINREENSNLKWMTFDEFLKKYHQDYMRIIYEKTVKKVLDKYKEE
jgi:8-oxo-dGTP pyrophosphatase MutT (NUDIX family)